MPITARNISGNLRERRARETRESLLSAGRALFAERGYAATTIEEIAARAGMTRGAFYKHFGDKAELFEAVLRVLADELVDHVWARSYELATSRGERERFAARLFVERMSAPGVNRILAVDGPAALGHERWSRILGDSIFAPLRAAVEGWSARGWVPPGLVDPLTHLLAGLFQTATIHVAAAPDDEHAARRYEDALVFVVRSLRGEREDP